MTTPADPDDLIAFLHQQFENQRFRGESVKTLAFAMPAPETAAYLTETGDLLLADVDAKRRILDECESALRKSAPRSNLNDLAWLVLRPLALPYADRPGYREEWRP